MTGRDDIPDTTRSARRNRAVKAQDSARWCETCQAWGDHHTDRCASVSEVES